MYDLILKNGLVADGGRAKPYRADVCIQNGCVAKITRQLDETANTVLDVAGLVVAPGFIDTQPLRCLSSGGLSCGEQAVSRYYH